MPGGLGAFLLLLASTQRTQRPGPGGLGASLLFRAGAGKPAAIPQTVHGPPTSLYLVPAGIALDEFVVAGAASLGPSVDVVGPDQSAAGQPAESVAADAVGPDASSVGASGQSAGIGAVGPDPVDVGAPNESAGIDAVGAEASGAGQAGGTAGIVPAGADAGAPGNPAPSVGVDVVGAEAGALGYQAVDVGVGGVGGEAAPAGASAAGVSGQLAGALASDAGAPQNALSLVGVADGPSASGLEIAEATAQQPGISAADASLSTTGSAASGAGVDPTDIGVEQVQALAEPVGTDGVDPGASTVQPSAITLSPAGIETAFDLGAASAASQIAQSTTESVDVGETNVVAGVPVAATGGGQGLYSIWKRTTLQATSLHLWTIAIAKPIVESKRPVRLAPATARSETASEGVHAEFALDVGAADAETGSTGESAASPVIVGDPTSSSEVEAKAIVLAYALAGEASRTDKTSAVAEGVDIRVDRAPRDEARERLTLRNEALRWRTAARNDTLSHRLSARKRAA